MGELLTLAHTVIERKHLNVTPEQLLNDMQQIIDSLSLGQVTQPSAVTRQEPQDRREE